MNTKRRRLEVGYYTEGHWALEYEDGGRTYRVKGEDGKTVWFPTRDRAEAFIQERGQCQE